jgi:hypothetical protein
VNGNYYFGSTSFSSTPGFTQGNGLTDFAQVSPAGAVPELDFYPAADAPFLDVLDDFPLNDFNGLSRPQGNMGGAGAYEYTSTDNPGWRISESFKEISGPVHVKKTGPYPGTMGTTARIMIVPGLSQRLIKISVCPTGSGMQVRDIRMYSINGGLVSGQ